ncbi:hypothetical protein BDB00DRAFT_628901 [Zychaea mexicana]|uniref:uncharacterized protein n=1 Tax=Zychaea mexicana TaxID=64656 RepID=UPI0022FEE5FC|nr:uncharacterized protein BDB00DRAFT_628901 [Zychaea mexicana]KAI9497551.1 hypothetical protein BDB00DRAFT_628901 [Zychaea mexicana]
MADQDDSLWQPVTHGNRGSDQRAVSSQQQQQWSQREVPRWQHIRTPAEQQDTENSLRALESMLARLKSRPVRTRPTQESSTFIQEQQEAWHDDDDSSIDASSVREGEDAMTAAEEDHEGLYLLWRERAQSGSQEEASLLDKALQRQKLEQEYTWPWTLAWIPRCCSCCLGSSSSSS